MIRNYIFIGESFMVFCLSEGFRRGIVLRRIRVRFSAYVRVEEEGFVVS